ncbi:hypothetical protein F5887DRAFT_885713 [Amanita rubescens]|nr:hypothetical protein F5887DRAFT_885713 [Amanita rubescens]
MKCHAALVRLHPDIDTLAHFRELKADDLKSSTALLNPNQPGSTSVELSWIWQAGLSTRGETPERLREFQRVHWLRARAQMHRWSEEVTLVGYEMRWTVQYYVSNMKVWEARMANPMSGPAAYAARKSAMWKSMAMDAEDTFEQGNKSYVRCLQVNKCI